MTAPIIRQDIWTLSQQDEWHPVIRAYALAVGVLVDRSKQNRGDPTGWRYQASVHGGLSDPDTRFQNQCQHRTYYFPAWHRMYLHFFESIVRSVIANLDEVDDRTKQTWGLPYWNYSRGETFQVLPPAFRAVQLWDGKTDNPLFHLRNRNLNNGGKLPDTDVRLTSTLAPGAFVGTGTGGFAGPAIGLDYWGETPGAAFGSLETTPHNDVHVHVGGDMNSQMSPLDPIFWLHHANVDRLWEVWLAQGGRSNPADRGFLDQDFWFHDADGVPQRKKVAELLTLADLGYSYEDTSPPAGPLGAEAVAPEPEHPSQMIGATDRTLQLAGDSATVRIPLEAPSGPLAADDTPAKVYLRLDDLTAPRAPGVTYAVYIAAPAGDESTWGDHFVGTLAPFGIVEEGKRDVDHHAMRFIFDITELYNHLVAAGKWTNPVDVRFVPIGVEAPPGPLAADDMVPGLDADPGVLNVGQVSVHVQ